MTPLLKHSRSSTPVRTAIIDSSGKCCQNWKDKHDLEKEKSDKLERKVVELEDSIENKNQQIIYLVKDTQQTDVDLKKEKAEHEKLKLIFNEKKLEFKNFEESRNKLLLEIEKNQKNEMQLKTQMGEKSQENKVLVGKLELIQKEKAGLLKKVEMLEKSEKELKMKNIELLKTIELLKMEKSKEKIVVAPVKQQKKAVDSEESSLSTVQGGLLSFFVQN